MLFDYAPTASVIVRFANRQITAPHSHRESSRLGLINRYSAVARQFPSGPSAQPTLSTANPFPDLPAIRGPDANSVPAPPPGPIPRKHPSPRFGDYSRTWFESRVAFGSSDEDEGGEEIAPPTRHFSLLEITSGPRSGGAARPARARQGGPGGGRDNARAHGRAPERLAEGGTVLRAVRDH